MLKQLVPSQLAYQGQPDRCDKYWYPSDGPSTLVRETVPSHVAESTQEGSQCGENDIAGPASTNAPSILSKEVTNASWQERHESLSNDILEQRPHGDGYGDTEQDDSQQ
jgi:hypothetical protein